MVLVDRGRVGFEIEAGHARDGTPVPHEARFSTSIASKVLRSGRAEALLDVGDDVDMDGGSVLELQLRHVLCAPLSPRGKGVLYADSRLQANAFTRRSLEGFSRVAGQCGVVLEKTSLRSAVSEAKAVQRAMLPEGPLVGPGIAIAGSYRPCTDASGDYFDWLELGAGRYATVMGDVSGHGLGASLFMAAARSLLRALLPRSGDPAEALRAVNRALASDMPPGTFMSLFLGEVDVREGTLRYASAGHEPALLHRAARGSVEELGATGPALGILPEGAWGLATASDLRRGDVLLLYTDGATEALGKDRERFGLARLRRHFAEAAALPPTRVLERLEGAVDAWGSRADDCSMLVARIR
jgi:hypothetical protein